MKILFIYPSAQGYGRIPIGLSIITTILLQKKHRVELFDPTFLTTRNTDNLIREKAKFVLPVETSHLYEKHSKEHIDKMLKDKFKFFSPDLVAISIVEDNYQYGDHFLQIIKELDKNIPVIAGGSTPTIAPEVIIENPYIDYLIQGEGEESMEEFCDLLQKGKSVKGVENLWYKENGRIKNNPIRPFIDMNTLPVQNLDLWDKKHLFKAYCGKLLRVGFFEMSRGCLNKCSYCVNHSCQILMRDAGKYFRKKSIAKAIKEIRILKNKYNLEAVFFCDDNFLLMSQERLKEFADSWKRHINLPYWMNTTVESINRQKLIALKETGCFGIGLGIESGSEWLRKNVLKRNDNNAQIEKTFKLVDEFEIRTTANAMIGFPGEYEEDAFETIKLIKNIKPKNASMAFVAAYIGTAIHAVARKLGYIDLWDKPGFRGMVKNITLRNNPTIRNPHITSERLTQILFSFTDYIEGRLPIPDKYNKPAPGSDRFSPVRDDMSRDVIEAFKSLNLYK